MRKTKLLLYACAGSLVTVLIWSFVGGYHTTPDMEMEPTLAEEISFSEAVPEAVAETVDTEEILIEEGVIEKEVIAVVKESKFPVEEAPPVLMEEKMERIHVIDKGDTLWAISRTYGVPVNAIQAANGIEDAGSLSIGQKLKIPGA